jgi:SAM-dependent methyltransferase
MRDAQAKSSPEFWEQLWRDGPLSPPIEPDDPSPRNHFYRLLDRRFAAALQSQAGGAKDLIEIGCGGSRWLPYFSRRFGLRVSGIDYNEAGCRSAERLLAASGVTGEIVHADMFDPPPRLLGRFDVAVSFGLVEHFDDPAAAVSACAALLHPGGLLITLVPTMSGLHGLIYRLLRPAVYAIHRPQRREALSAAHRDAGLRVQSCEYLLGLPGVVSTEGAVSCLTPGLGGRLARGLSNGYWWLEQQGLGLPPGPWTSPYALCLACRPR